MLIDGQVEGVDDAWIEEAIGMSVKKAALCWGIRKLVRLHVYIFEGDDVTRS
jgi:hypothetical protein